MAQIAKGFAQSGVVDQGREGALKIEKLKKAQDCANAGRTKPGKVGRFGEFVIALKLRDKTPPKQNDRGACPAKQPWADRWRGPCGKRVKPRQSKKKGGD